EGAVRRVRGRGGVCVLLRRRGRAVRGVRPPRAPRQQARRQAPPALAAQPGGAVLVGAADTAASALRHLPGEARAPVLQGGPGDPVPRLRRAGAHGQRAGHAPHPVPAHGRAPLRLSAEPAARPPPSEEDENDSSSSSISEYLTKTLPGWHVEDFLVDETAAATAIGVSADVSYQ
ncbi:hypothetical protein ACJX0J_026106, partial [Zea mays]